MKEQLPSLEGLLQQAHQSDNDGRKAAGIFIPGYPPVLSLRSASLLTFAQRILTTSEKEDAMLQKYQKNTIISAVEVEENGHQKNRETFQCSRIADQWELSGNLCDWMHRDQRTAVVLAIISHCHLSSIGLDAWLIQTKESISGKTFHPRAIVFRLKEAFQIGEAIIHDILLKESMTNHTSRSAGSVS